MWLFTDFGFFSAVQHRDDPTKVMVRARARADLQSLLDRNDFVGDVDIVTTPAADYPYRIVVDKTDWTAAVARAASSVDYDNFKGAVAARQGWNRADAYHHVWHACHAIMSQEDCP